MLLLATAFTPVATATPGGAAAGGKQTVIGPPTDADVAKLAVQKKLDDAADQVRSAGDQLGDSGFAGDRIDVDSNTVTVYWHGGLPKPVASIVDEIRRTGINVDVRAAKYTLKQLLEETERLVRAGSVEGVPVVKAGPSTDGSGVDVTVDGEVADSLAANPQALAPKLSKTVDLTVSRGKAPKSATRYSDTPAYWGGSYAVIYDQDGTAKGACTTGFGVAGNNGAARYLLTAAHCGTGVWKTGTGTTLGSVIPTIDYDHDAELVLTDAGSAVYEGPGVASGDTNNGRTITSASTTHVGDSICEGGAQTGSVCGFTVTAVNLSFTISGFGYVSKMVQVEAYNKVAGVGNGDSGGPVYSISGSQGVARGTISAYSGDPAEEVSCYGVPTSQYRHCSWRWFYPDVTWQIATLGVHF